MTRVLLATGMPGLDEAISRVPGYNFIDATVSYKKDIAEAYVNFRPDIVIVTERLSGQEMLSGILINLKQKYPSVRIIYLAGEVNMSDVNKVTKLGAMVMAGIYDIITEKVINKSLIESMLLSPKTYPEVEYLLRYFMDKKKDNETAFEYKEEVEADVESINTYNNVYMISSIKPGCGKSFVSTNVATAIAKFGEKKEGRAPRICLLEADLQTLSLGTLLSLEDDKHNLKTVLDKISTIVDEKGNVTDSELKKSEVNEYILSSFKSYPKCKNLYALVGSQLSMEELEGVSPYYYAYLINIISQNFDIVIIDSNSSLRHVTTYPLLTMVNVCYYILNLDFNNVRNNQRYRASLKELEVYDKVKYVLNEDLSDYSDSPEKLDFSADLLQETFDLEARIPALDKIVFLNRVWQGTPCVLDESDYTLKARYELCKIANQIYPLRNLGWLERELSKVDSSKKEKKGLMFRKK